MWNCCRSWPSTSRTCPRQTAALGCTTTGATAPTASSPRTRAICVDPARARRRVPATWSRPCTGPASASSWTWSSTTPRRAARTARPSTSRGWATRSSTTSTPPTAAATGTTPAAATRSTATTRWWPDSRRLPRLLGAEMHVDGFRFDLASVLARGEDGNAHGPPAAALAHRVFAHARRAQHHRRGLGRGRPLPGRRLPRLALGGVERPLPRCHPRASCAATRAWSARSPPASPAAATCTSPAARLPSNSRQLHHLSRRLHPVGPGELQPQAQRRPTARTTATAATTTSAGTAASRARPTTRRSALRRARPRTSWPS